MMPRHVRGFAGKLLSQSVRDIYDEFMANMEKWQHIEYDIIDVGAAEAFSLDYNRFMSVMRELERRLCQVVLAAFDDCATMSATFKLLDSFEGLLERDIIAQVRSFTITLNPVIFVSSHMSSKCSCRIGLLCM